MSLGQRRMDQLFVTHVYSTPGQSPMYWNHPVSVSYDTKREMWTIANDDAEPMPEGIVFNVRIEPSAQVVKGANWKSRFRVPPVCEPPFEDVHAVAIDHPSAYYPRRQCENAPFPAAATRIRFLQSRVDASGASRVPLDRLC